MSLFSNTFQIGPIAAPLWLWLSCIGLIIFFAVFLYKLRTESRRIIQRFNKLRKEILEIPPHNKSIDGIGLEQIREIMNKDEVLEEFWNEFEETLLLEDDKNGQGMSIVYNTRQANEFFSEDALIGAKINLNYYGSIPGILTSMGLLLTFMAILTGLSHIHPDINGKLTGVEELVYSLSGKFISSICALLLAIAFTFFEKKLASKIHRAYQSFVNALNRRFTRMPSEHFLRDIRRDIGQQSIAFRQFGTDLSGHLKESFREGMDPLIQRIAEALEKLTKEKSETLNESLGGMIGEFKSSLMGSANNEFKALSDALGSTVLLLKEMNQQSQVSQKQTSELISNFELTISRQSNTGSEHISKLSNTMEIVLTKLHEVSASSSDSFSNTVSTVLQQIQQTTTHQLTENSKRSEEMTLLLGGIMQQIQNTMTDSSASVQSTVSGIISKSADWSQATSEQIEKLIKEQTQNASSISEARQLLNESLSIFKSSIQEGSNTLKQLDLGSRAMTDGLNSIQSTMTKVSNIQENLNDLATLIDKNAMNLTQVIDRQSQILSSYEKVFAGLDKGIGSLLSQISSSLENYSARVKSSLEENLNRFDNALGDATGKLGNTVELLSEKLDDLSDIVDQALKVKA